MALLAENSETEVCNRALSHIKKPSLLSSIDEDQSHTANVLRLHYPARRDALQRRYPWNFCEERASLNGISETPPFGFAYYFDLPENCLWVREVKGCGKDKWKVVANRRIACNLRAPLKITYTKRIVEVPNWDPLFKEVMAMHLALAIAPELATDETIIANVKTLADEMLEDAFPSDAAESGEDTLPDSDWVTCR